MKSLRFKLLFCTLYYLKPIQIRYRIKLILKKYLFFEKIKWEVTNKDVCRNNDILLGDSIFFTESYKIKDDTFAFLNLSHSFSGNIDWEYMDYGKLWCYNLNYFEFLRQSSCSKEIGCKLIDDYIDKLPLNSVGMEPYPLSLRCYNWIYFFVKHQIDNETYNVFLYQQLKVLTGRLEYHLLGNHLLENGFALLFGAYYFDDLVFYKKAKQILLPELQEQTLKDGANFELSPMYHCIILLRILDVYNLMKSNSSFSQELLPFFENIALKMLAWLDAMTFKDGNIPLFNDAAFEIAPLPIHLFEYAYRMGLAVKKGVLSESGYRKFSNNKFELVVDVAKVGPDYQPGHAHADTFNFELHIHGRPVIVDTGTSTYEINKSRFYERSSAAHNTVVVAGKNSSEVWAGHRVGKRAYVRITNDCETELTAWHDGYGKELKHYRTFKFTEDVILIEDQIACKAEAYLHFHPSEQIEIKDNYIVGSDYIIECIGAVSICLLKTYFAPKFNIRIPSVTVRIDFENNLQLIFR